MARDTPERDYALLALQRLVAALDDAEQDFAAVRARARLIEAERAEGRPYRDLVAGEAPPLIVQTVSKILERLSSAGADWRREEARALHEEGVSMDRIAALFGVTRQRVGALLSAPAGRPD